MAAAPGQLTMEQWKKRSNFLRALRWLTTNRDEDLTPEALIEQFTVYVQENARTGKVTAQMNHDVVFSEFVTSKYRDPNTPEWFWSHEKKGGAGWKLNPQGLGKKRRKRERESSSGTERWNVSKKIVPTSRVLSQSGAKPLEVRHPHFRPNRK